MKAIIVGYGEIGKALETVFSPFHEISVCDIGYTSDWKDCDILLVSIPYSDKFVEIVEKYQDRYKPKATIIFSTVAIGTTSGIKNAVHSPVEGKHPELAESIKSMRRWVGGENEDVLAFLKIAKMDVIVVKEPEFTEFLKLRSTSKYGINIEFARYEKSVCDSIGMDFILIKEFDCDYNHLYRKMGIRKFQRYILDPPEGEIGGHCIVPNAKILDEQYPSELLKQIYKDGR